jgi:hypothetical protein
MVDDFSDPEVPKSPREFYMLYFQNMQKNQSSFDGINQKIDAIIESQADDRDNMMAIFGKWDGWKVDHDKELKVNLKCLERHDEKIDSLEKKVNTWSLTNTLAAIGAFVTALFMKGS